MSKNVFNFVRMQTWSFAIAVGISGFTLATHATTISGPFTLGFNSGSGTLTASVVPGTMNWDETINAYNSGYWFVGFSLPNNGEGATGYTLTKKVTNNTGRTWEDFLINTGCGNHGELTCPFFPIQIDLNKPILISESNHTGAFLSPAPVAHSLHWINMSVAPTQSVTFTFDLTTCANCQGGWQVFQQPSLAPVPELGTAVLSAAGLLALMLTGRRRLGAGVDALTR